VYTNGYNVIVFLFWIQTEEGSSSSAEDLIDAMSMLKISADTTVHTPETGSTGSSSEESSELPSENVMRRNKLNVFLEECKVLPLGRPWLDWEDARERAKLCLLF